MKSAGMAGALIGALVLMGIGLPRTGPEDGNPSNSSLAQLAQAGRQTEPVGQRRDETRKPDTDAQRRDNEAARQSSQGSRETERRENQALRRVREPTPSELRNESAVERLRRESFEAQKQTEKAGQSKTVPLSGCAEGYVSREAVPGDHVCVTPEARSQVLRDNNQALDRRDPKGAQGPNTCVEGYVWRESTPGDQVCVTPEARAQATRDNSEAVNRISR